MEYIPIENIFMKTKFETIITSPVTWFTLGTFVFNGLNSLSGTFSGKTATVVSTILLILGVLLHPKTPTPEALASGSIK